MASVTMQNSRLAMVGALHVDDIAHSFSPLVSRASNPVSWKQRLGGVAANAACAAAQCRIENQTIQFTAAVGDDLPSRSLEAALSASNIIPRLQKMSGYATGRYTAIMNNDGELYIGLADVTLAEQLNSDHVQEIARNAPYAALLVDANLTATCLASFAAFSGSSGTPLAALTVSPVKSLRLRPIAAQVGLLFCNRREAMALIANHEAAAELDGKNDVSMERLAEGLTDLGFTQIVLTDAREPVLVQDNENRYHIPVPRIENPHTVNGAGDALAGASFAAWASGMNLHDSVKNIGLTMAANIVRGEQQAIAL